MSSKGALKAKLKKKGVFFTYKLPSVNRIVKNCFMEPRRKGRPAMVVCDKKLRAWPELKAWGGGNLIYYVPGGEKLKDLENFPRHVKGVLQKSNGQDLSGFISVGGGSVGDWTGFLASVYKRGRPLVHIPTTWLSAMDSAHGGKTALNAEKVKNVLGSYCFPKAVFIVKNLICRQKETPSAYGEMVKMALIEGGGLYKNFLSAYAVNTEQPVLNKKKSFVQDKERGKSLLWPFLPPVVYSKIRIVEKDPYEQKGQRILLNLGHTVGHVLESCLALPHGEAVLYGLRFALAWSHRRFGLSPSFLKETALLMRGTENLSVLLQKIPARTLPYRLGHDKKRRGEKHIDFIFIRGPGRVFAKPVLIQDLLLEWHRAGMDHLLNQTGFEKGATFGLFSSHQANVKHAFSNKVSISVTGNGHSGSDGA